MKRTLLMIGLAAAVTLAGCGGGGGGNNSGGNLGGGGTTGTTTTVTAANGGTVTAAATAGNVSVCIPAGALATDTAITVAPVATSPVTLPNSNVFLVGVTLGPNGTTFSSPVTIDFPLATAKAAGSKLLVLLYDANGNPKTSQAGIATVDAGGTTASMTVTHFSTYILTGSYVLGGTATNGPGMGFIFSTGIEFDGAPVDFAFIASGPSIQPNHSPAKITTAAYDSITQATEGGYDLQNPIAIQAGTVLLFKGQMPGDDHYYKMVVTDITASTVSFVYAQIAAPVSIVGQWDIGSGRTLSIMASSVAGGYIADVHDSNNDLVSMAAGSLVGSVLSGAQSDAVGNVTGSFTITFDATFTHFTGTWNGTKL